MRAAFLFGEKKLSTLSLLNWYIYFGFMERGGVGKLWLKAMPLRMSRGEPRIPQSEDFLRALEEARFSSATKCVLFTDSAPALSAVGHLAICQHESVNHSEKEFTRSVEVLDRGERRNSPHRDNKNELFGSPRHCFNFFGGGYECYPE